ncbi:LuxR C-terminal-related transcriptional regulator [Amycolatopsis sp. FDAARGOS 1241]|uniref:LuxR C-terminal-related transcriptional regulator n=1 Tax=Amycolatopsis sp. FDAARGOS 1241 TaxID=2778070 RepID=UPI0019521FF6|nr:LuxR C-terminal-related transcriptional regulator [Amycolatopsis sp. FDAARGOS 1241]QRP49528.1 AAA family ATPase [Amycolatopsis sp. FDAARGOS 1241]
MGTLPAELTSFIGRQRELSEIRRLLSASRLITLTGAGGVGKTRLAVRVADQVRHTFPDGAWLIELGDLHDPALLAQTVTAAFGIRDADEDPPARLTEYLRGKSMLLVLDNCEHLAEACARFARDLLAAAPDIRILATSRHVLAVEGERVYAVEPLAVRPVRDLADAVSLDAVTLFTERATAVSSGFSLDADNWAGVVEVCRRLDGLPLAIELAAVWVRTLSVDELLDRLDDTFQLLSRNALAPQRQKSLVGTIDWSYLLCTPRQRLLWTRLSVFAGGFHLDAAEEVCAGDGIERADVLALVAALVDKSLVQTTHDRAPTRFRMLQTIREYGRQKLAEAGDEPTMRDRHSEYFHRLAANAQRDWDTGAHQVQVYTTTRRDHANLRTALEHDFSTPGRYAAGLDLVVTLHFFWLHCGHLTEGRLWLARALGVNEGASRNRARALWISGYAACLMGEPRAALPLLQEADEWGRRHNDVVVLGHTEMITAACHFLQGDFHNATTLFREANERFSAIPGFTSIKVLSLGTIGQSEAWAGDPATAIAVAERGLAICDSTGELRARTHLLYARSLGQWMLGDHDAAEAGLLRGVRTARQFNDILSAAICIAFLAWTAAAMGRAELAAERLGVADRVWPLVGGKVLLGQPRALAQHATCEHETREALGDARYRTAFKRGAEAATSFEAALAHILGENVPAPTPAAPVTREPSEPELTTRELEVAELVAEGLTNKEIAQRLVISRRTVESHVDHILGKLGFSSRSRIPGWLVERRS